jgi:hypothetical protein
LRHNATRRVHIPEVRLRKTVVSCPLHTIRHACRRSTIAGALRIGRLVRGSTSPIRTARMAILIAGGRININVDGSLNHHGNRVSGKRIPGTYGLCRMPMNFKAVAIRSHSAVHSVIEWNDKAVQSVRKGFSSAAPSGLRTTSRRTRSGTPKPLGRCNDPSETAGYLGMTVEMLAGLRPPPSGPSSRRSGCHRRTEVTATGWRQNGREQTGTNAN